MQLFDETGGSTSINSTADAPITENVWRFVVATYDGGEHPSGVNLYEDGAVVASTDEDDAAYVAMKDLPSTFQLAHQRTDPVGLFDGKMAGGPLGPFFSQKELTSYEVLQLYEIGREALGLVE